MRFAAMALVSFSLVGGCAGNVADYIGPRAPIITPQLARFGFDETQTQCVSLRLGSDLRPLQLRKFARQASAVNQSFFGAGPTLAPRDLAYIAAHNTDTDVSNSFANALEACSVTTTAASDTETGVAIDASPRGPTWLNLGAASSGQAIAVDASSLQQEGSFKTAWFRLTNPGANVSTGITYLLRIDCSARTISPQADRRQDAQGIVTEERQYGAEEQGPLPIEGGTVMEIAFLSLCT
jgi:hypothetical protein